MIKILFFNITHISHDRGSEKWIKTIATYLSDKYDVTVITTDIHKSYDIKNTKFKYFEIKYKKRFIGFYDINEMKKYIDDFDVIYSMYGWTGIEIKLLRYFNYNKMIFGHHSLINNTAQRTYYILIERLPFIKKAYHHLLTEYRANIYKRKGYKRIFVIPNWIEINKYIPKDKENEIFEIICPGVVNIDKGIDILIKVAKRLQNYKDIKFFIAGHKPEINKLPNNIYYLGMLSEDEYIKIISSKNLMFLPTRADIFPFSTLENLAIGNPVVVSNLPDVISAFGESESIYYAKLGDIDDYIKGILYYYNIWKSNLEKYHELSKKARDIALKFDSKIVLPKIEKMFRTVYKNI
ncbi:MAG: glycosyltransferase family 4 protein [Nanopusillaceae archaeon]